MKVLCTLSTMRPWIEGQVYETGEDSRLSASHLVVGDEDNPTPAYHVCWIIKHSGGQDWHLSGYAEFVRFSEVAE